MPIRTEREYRRMELRAEDGADKMTVTGYATVFDHIYELYSYGGVSIRERVDPQALDSADMSDVIMQYDHAGHVYARQSNGTLKLSVDDNGLAIRADLAGTSAGRQLYEEIKGGYTKDMSYAFRVKKDKWEVEKDENGTEIHTRTILEISKVYDVSAVSIPANDATSISARALFDGEIERAEAERLEAQRRKRERERLELRLKLTTED